MNKFFVKEFEEFFIVCVMNVSIKKMFIGVQCSKMNLAQSQPRGNQAVLFQRESTRERCYFIIQRIKKNKENKENQSVCILCDGKNRTDEFLFHRCMCRWCKYKEKNDL